MQRTGAPNVVDAMQRVVRADTIFAPSSRTGEEAPPQSHHCPDVSLDAAAVAVPGLARRLAVSSYRVQRASTRTVQAARATTRPAQARSVAPPST